jgi:hypothetical protein
MAPSIQSETGFIPLVAYAGFIIALFQMVKYVANAIGIKEIQQGYDFARKAVTGLAMAGAAAVGGAALTGIAGSQTFRNVGQRLTQVPVLNSVGYKMLNQYHKARFSDVKKYEEMMKDWTPPELLEIANGIAPNPTNKQANAQYKAAIKLTAKQGRLTNDSRGLEYIRTHLNDPDLNAHDILNAFPHFFHRVGDHLEEINTRAQDYMNDIVHAISNMDAEDLAQNHHRERIFQEAERRGVDLAELRRQITQHTTRNQQVALFGNIDPEVWNTEGWGGEQGLIATAVRGTPAEETLNRNLASSPRLQEVLGMTSLNPGAAQAQRTPPRPGAAWNPTFNCWVYPTTGVHNTPQGQPPSANHYWSTITGTWQPF